MQIIINVPEKLICEGFKRSFTKKEKNILLKAIGNGTVIPKGHGKIGDIDKLYNIFNETCKDFNIDNINFKSVMDMNFELTPAIIEADESEG